MKPVLSQAGEMVPRVTRHPRPPPNKTHASAGRRHRQPGDRREPGLDLEGMAPPAGQPACTQVGTPEVAIDTLKKSELDALGLWPYGRDPRPPGGRQGDS